MSHVEPPQPAAGLASSAVPPAPIAWPPGVTAAACLTFDMDAEAPMLTTDISAITRMTAMSHQSYGPLVGVPRILALLKRHDIRATFYCHPFLSGRPSRAEALERLIERMKSLDGLWITTVSEVARHTASLKLAPRTCPQPVIPPDAYWVTRPG